MSNLLKMVTYEVGLKGDQIGNHIIGFRSDWHCVLPTLPVIY